MNHPTLNINIRYEITKYTNLQQFSNNKITILYLISHIILLIILINIY
jgi:hypothetical protein